MFETKYHVSTIETMLKSIHSDEYRQLISWLREQREAQGLTMRDFATKLSEHHSVIGKIEQGERRLDVGEYLQYCRALGVSPTEGLKVINSSI